MSVPAAEIVRGPAPRALSLAYRQQSRAWPYLSPATRGRVLKKSFTGLRTPSPARPLGMFPADRATCSASPASPIALPYAETCGDVSVVDAAFRGACATTRVGDRFSFRYLDVPALSQNDRQALKTLVLAHLHGAPPRAEVHAIGVDTASPRAIRKESPASLVRTCRQTHIQGGWGGLNIHHARTATDIAFTDCCPRPTGSDTRVCCGDFLEAHVRAWAWRWRGTSPMWRIRVAACR